LRREDAFFGSPLGKRKEALKAALFKKKKEQGCAKRKRK